jgi:hypothetical protein
VALITGVAGGQVLVSAEELQRNREWLSLQVPVALPEQLQRMSARLEAQVAAAWRRDMATGEAAVQHLSVERDWDAGACHRTRSLFDMHLGRWLRLVVYLAWLRGLGAFAAPSRH